ncbi:MAG: hypothetical protein ACYC5Y_05860 [Symbiobacteriia bacterium]
MSWFGWALAAKETGNSMAAGRSAVRRGRFGTVSWEARVAASPVSYGLNPSTLLKGRGRVARLVVYQHIGRQEVPHKLAVYDRGWHFGRKRHLPIIQRVMAELERQGNL